ncbi:MAG: hypothetical protein FJ000_01405 [Actinobacteria bacterium]|nr:hypothetical protein [Actinomycetota bacterium]
MRPVSRRSAGILLSIATILVLLAVSGCAGRGVPTATPVGALQPSPSSGGTSAWSGAAATPATELDRVRAAFDEAAAALTRRSLAAWHAALPVDGDASDLKGGLDALYTKLAAVRPRAVRSVVEPIPGRDGYYSVSIVGGLGRPGPPDRILAERVLQVRGRLGVVVALGDTSLSAESSPALSAVRVVADDTPPAVAAQGIMAFHRPRVAVIDDVTVVYEKAWRQRAAELAGHAAAARAHVAGLYGVDTEHPLVLLVYGSREQVRDALAAAPGVIDPRIKYFSHPAARKAHDLWSPTDVGIIAPALNGSESWAPVMLQHEVAHAYTLGWFFDTEHAPDFLQEGLAVAAEGSHDWSALKAVLAHGELSPAVRDAIALGDIWSGRPTEDVRVLYSAAGSMVDFILERWDPATVRRWVRAVADSDLSHEEIAAATRRHLGLGWAAFEAEWREHVERLP